MMAFKRAWMVMSRTRASEHDGSCQQAMHDSRKGEAGSWRTLRQSQRCLKWHVSSPLGNSEASQVRVSTLSLSSSSRSTITSTSQPFSVFFKRPFTL